MVVDSLLNGITWLLDLAKRSPHVCLPSLLHYSITWFRTKQGFLIFVLNIIKFSLINVMPGVVFNLYIHRYVSLSRIFLLEEVHGLGHKHHNIHSRMNNQERLKINHFQFKLFGEWWLVETSLIIIAFRPRVWTYFFHLPIMGMGELGG